MNELSGKTCAPCSKGAVPLTADEASRLLNKIPGWEIVRTADTPSLQCYFDFKNFQQALNFTNRVGDLAEQENHHPQIITEWGRVTVRWWTHKIKGLHQNDFIMAAKTSSLFNGQSPDPL